MATVKNSKKTALSPQEAAARFQIDRELPRIQWSGTFCLVRDPINQEEMWWVNYGMVPAAKTLRAHDRVKRGRDWSVMLHEDGVRERITSENPQAAELLDFLVERRHPINGAGWTAFNDWLDDCFRRDLPALSGIQNRPTVSEMRQIVFPTCR